MWRSLLFASRRPPSHIRGCLRTRITPNAHLSCREASASSLIPFRWVKKSEKTPQLPIEAVEQTTTEGGLVKVQNKLKKFEKQEEKFIPVTRRTLVNKLVEEDGLLNWDEKRLVESFAASLDAYYSQKFYAILEEAKLLYDYMDPDKYTYQTRELSKKEILDNEYRLLLKVNKFFDKANFFEIPKHQLAVLLHDRDLDGLLISVDPSDYETLRIWTRGRTTMKRPRTLILKNYIRSFFRWRSTGTPPSIDPEFEVYTRVCVAVRSRGEKKLFFKAFKDVPCGKLEYLLPDGKIKMSNFDKGFLATSVVLGGITVAMRSLPAIADLVKVQWTWLALGLAGAIGARAWIGYKNKRNHYLANLATTLYYKTVANNRGVLTLLADRAQDEEFKEAILAYVFLLSPRNRRGVPGTQYTADPPIYDTPQTLQDRINKWLGKRFNLTNVTFDIDDALEKLDNLGVLVRRPNGTLTVLNIKDSLDILPEPSFRWQAAGALRDMENSDDKMSLEESERVELHGWR